MFKYIKFLLLSLLCMGLTQCKKTSNPPRSLTPAEQSLVQSDNKFGLKLFREIINQEPNKNVFISPLSVSMALGMTYNGADGETKEAMERTLEISGLSLQEINESYKSLIELLIDLDPKVEVLIANSIWYRNDVTFEQAFLDICQEYFSAVVSGLDFSSPDALKIINTWVSEHTKGKIKEIVDEISRDSMMFLINAIYFKGTWTYKFDKNKTVDDLFKLPDGSQKPCKMMKQEGDFQYFSNPNFQVIDLPYGDGYYRMTIFLPSENNIDSLIAQLTEENWKEWTSSFTEKSGTLLLPKFTLEYELLLNDVLKALGMEIAFSSSQADFTKMYKPGGIYISKVKHKTFIEVNEEGTEAAAATEVEIRRSGPFSMKCNRPFVFAMRENHSQTILFMGKIVEPKLE
jgi:serine protease inhibitor